MTENENLVAAISDIHGNFRALERVWSDIQARGIKRVICLGDIIGYGPNPKEVTNFIREQAANGTIEVVLQGNHERNLNALHQVPNAERSALGINDRAFVSIHLARTKLYGDHPAKPSPDYIKELAKKWSNKVDLSQLNVQGGGMFRSVKPAHVVEALFQQGMTGEFAGFEQDKKLFETGKEIYAWFKSLPKSHVEGEDVRIGFYHDNNKKPGDDAYTLNLSNHKRFNEPSKWASIDETCDRAVKDNINIVLVGHAHIGKIYPVDSKYRDQGVLKVVDVGSVGFSRFDEKNRAMYAIVDPTNTKTPVQIIRLEYAWRACAKEMEKKKLILPNDWKDAK